MTGLGAALAASGYTNGCPIATTALEASTTSEAICRVSAEAFRSWEQPVAQRLVEFGWTDAEAASTATLILSSLEDALLLSRAYRSIDPFTAVADGLSRALEKPKR